ncbi:MAG: aspartate aminotransferase family protein [bacterium]|nr:aspartate aminotransferase family protein [bacterium]
MNRAFRCSGYPLVKTDIVSARGCHLVDAAGRQFVDFEAGVWCLALGHSHPQINQAIRSQLERVAHISYPYSNDLVEAAAAAVLQVVGIKDGRCVFLSSGSEAVEFAVQAACHVTGRKHLLTLGGTFLASYGSAGSINSDQWSCFDWSQCAGCVERETCNPRCHKLENLPFGDIGAFVFEPGCSAGLVRFPPVAPMRLIAERVRDHGGLVVLNEVTAGMGRTGKWLGTEHYAIEPDLVALGKGLGNGYPVSAIALREDVADQLLSAGFRYAQSHQNDPLGCAVAIEVIDVLRKQELVARSARIGATFLDNLSRLSSEHNSIAEVRGRGLMLAVTLKGAPEDGMATLVHRQLLERGFIVGCKAPANVLRFFPPLIMPEQEFDRLIQSLDEVLGELH